EDPTGETFGAELLELLEGLADPEELDRLTGGRLDGERRATAGIAIELGEHDAGDVEALVEGLGGVDRVLADHGVDDQENVGRLHARLDLIELDHQGFVDRKAPRGVVEDVVVAPKA